ncbi:hypothetical protein LMG28727_06887 [Paraburkholderia kirstenboschensis]|uniref:hypothetical protein n=1 Tax=Paraburkholderia kirstenboschensis TaxID=1245436 RepID=UPI000AD0B02E|nr:hypothetical protein [Paraburkholderia kirstenboschensis]CAD6559568.1 hypothetical protein LMG28727_06887 [Paraburkholderia kirstenboschensis]
MQNGNRAIRLRSPHRGTFLLDKREFILSNRFRGSLHDMMQLWRADRGCPTLLPAAANLNLFLAWRNPSGSTRTGSVAVT